MFISNKKTAFQLSVLHHRWGGEGSRFRSLCCFVCSSTLPLYHILLFLCVSCLVDSERSPVNHVTTPPRSLPRGCVPPRSEREQPAACSTRGWCVCHAVAALIRFRFPFWFWIPRFGLPTAPVTPFPCCALGIPPVFPGPCVPGSLPESCPEYFQKEIREAYPHFTFSAPAAALPCVFVHLLRKGAR